MYPAMMFVPGSAPDKLARIPTLPGGALLLDLEDSVAASAKATARGLVGEALSRFGAVRPLWARVNAFSSELLYDDLEAVTVRGLEGINLPKVESARELHLVDWLLGALERRRGLVHGTVRLMATIESALGLQRVSEIATAVPRLAGLCFGAADFSRDLGLDWPPPDGQLPFTVLQAKAALVQASAAAGLDAPHDGASAEFRDLERLAQEAGAARALGFSGKHAIHPAQVPVIEAAFRPSEQQLRWASEVVAAFEQHAGEGIGAFAVRGVMVDAPVAARARQLLRQAGANGSRDDHS